MQGYKGNPQKNIGSKSNKQVKSLSNLSMEKAMEIWRCISRMAITGIKDTRAIKGNKGNGKNK